MRIIAGRWRGRTLAAPTGAVTRPTAERLRQAVFDMLMHAPWATLRDAVVLDMFAGTGALGLEALSRGAARAVFFEREAAALACLRANISACRAGDACEVIVGDACHPSPGPPAGLVFLDPPYRQGLVDAALAGLAASGRLSEATLVVAELARGDPPPKLRLVHAERAHGAGQVIIGQM